MKVSFTGHRPDKLKDPDKEKKLLEKKLKASLGDLTQHQYVVGGAPGFDTLALELLLSLGIQKENITIAVPFRGFEKFAGYNHQTENTRVYQFNNTCGVKVIEVGGADGSYAQKCFKRNQYLVDEAEIIFTNWNGSTGGTANTLKLAKKKGIEIVNITTQKKEKKV